MLHPRWFAFLPHVFHSALSLWRALLFHPFCFTFVKLYTFQFFIILSDHYLVFSSFFSRNFFSSPSATIFSILLLPLGFLLSFSSLCLSLILPQTLRSCFCLSKLCFFLPHEGRSEKVGWVFFLLWTPRNAPINTLKPCRGELAQAFQHSKSARAVTGSLTNTWKSAAYFKAKL